MYQGKISWTFCDQVKHDDTKNKTNQTMRADKKVADAKLGIVGTMNEIFTFEWTQNCSTRKLDQYSDCKVQYSE